MPSYTFRYRPCILSAATPAGRKKTPPAQAGRRCLDPGATKAAEKVRDVAAELLDIYAQRAAKAGFAFKHDREQYQLFCDGFPFETTPDQAQAINAVLSDMCQPLAMDRLGMRRCGLRQDRSGHARRLPRRGEPQAGGGAGADHPAGSAAL